MTENNPWAIAREKIENLGPVPPVFSLAIRSLMADDAKGHEQISTASQFLVSRLMLSPTMKSIVYHAVLTYHGESVTNTAYISSWDLVRIFKPADLASIIGAAFFYAKISKQISKEDLDRINDRIFTDTDLGGFIGYCIPSVTPAVGIMLGSFLGLSQAIFLLEPRNLTFSPVEDYFSGRRVPDIDQELEVYGFNSAQIISNMLQRLGFGMTWMNSFISSFSLFDTIPTFPEKVKVVDPMIAQMQYGHIWLTYLRETNSPPEFKLAAEFYPNKAELHRLCYLCENISRNGSKYQWLSRGKKDISPSLTPQLFQEYLAETASVEEVNDFCKQNFSDELYNDLSQEDLESISQGQGSLDE